MSTIASPRDPSAPPFTRRLTTQPATPTSSSRPSLDSASSSPQPVPAVPIIKRANRAALRSYYNLPPSSTPGTPTVEISSPSSPTTPSTTSELDSPAFNAPAFIAATLATSSLADLLRVYARVLGEIRALDAEKKALVYDNYSKLISATETIRRMRTTMDPLSPMAGALDVVVGRIYEEAVGVREGLRAELGGEEPEGRRRTRELAREVVGVVGRLRGLVEEGRGEEAAREWEVPRRLLVRWRERGSEGKRWGR
ncbi:Vps51/Vps67-domain-containing protein [Schizothecium vesticola]|uniref:Vacuolar protein sorting-associated protein 51 homolog n=1 Tax=Schizothecium vesticola TaxID=314040 RepID=A0AA40K8G0_9PEZI|nr:Vps51/Vps67-domain-containing protein [Schizothecium vesticola]